MVYIKLIVPEETFSDKKRIYAIYSSVNAHHHEHHEQQHEKVRKDSTLLSFFFSFRK